MKTRTFAFCEPTKTVRINASRLDDACSAYLDQILDNPDEYRDRGHEVPVKSGSRQVATVKVIAEGEGRYSLETDWQS